MTTTDGTPTPAPTEQPAPSTPAGDPSQEVKITKAEWDRVTSALGRISDLQGGRDIARQTQSEISKLRDDIRPLLERAHALGTENKPLGEALAQIQGEQSEAEFRKAVMELTQLMRGSAQPQSPGTAQDVDLTAVLAEYQLDPRDPYVAGKLAGQSFQTKEQAELFAARLLRDKVTAPPTNASQQAAIPGQGTSAGNGLDEKFRQLVQLQESPTKNFREIDKLTKELEAAGFFNQ